MSLSLVSPAFLWALRLLLAVSVVVVIWRWPKAAVPGVLAIGRRLLGLGIVSFLATLNLLAPVNAEYGWYMTVGDLLPAGQQASGATTHGGAPASAAIGRSRASSPLITGAWQRTPATLHLTPTSYGGFQDFTVRGGTSGFTGKVTVWFPPSYTSSAGTHRSYPVIEAFHGIQPAPYAYFGVIHIDEVIRDAVAARQMREALVVIPHWAPNKQDNECVNSPPGVTDGNQMETWLTQDVPAWAYATFRVEPGRTSWNAMGISAGGWCANMAAMLHPDVYASAISFGGYWQPDFDPSFVPFQPGGQAWRRYDLVDLTRRDPPAVAIWTLYGREDQLAGPTTGQVRHAVRAPMSLTATMLPRGAHNAEIWVPHFGEALAWLGANDPSFAAL